MNVIQMTSAQRSKFATSLLGNVSQPATIYPVVPKLYVLHRIMCQNVPVHLESLLVIQMTLFKDVKLSVVFPTKTVHHQSFVTDFPLNVWMFVLLILVDRMLSAYLKIKGLNVLALQIPSQILYLK
jgi:hypothetical protein